MDANRFDTLTRSLTGSFSRRRLVRGLAGAPLGLALARLPGVASANTRKKAKKSKLNTFGCLDLGAACGGKDDPCCSGICQGKKPKKGKTDKRKCGAHNVGNCTSSRGLCDSDATDSRCGPAGGYAFCLTTTGNAAFCANFNYFTIDNCRVCERDADCVALGFGPDSACAIYDGPSPCAEGNSCKAHGSSRGTGCFLPGT